jgi:hypothetical protein
LISSLEIGGIREGLMISFSKDFLDLVASDAEISGQTVSSQIESNYLLLRIIKQYESELVALFESMIQSKTETANIPFSFDKDTD